MIISSNWSDTIIVFGTTAEGQSIITWRYSFYI